MKRMTGELFLGSFAKVLIGIERSAAEVFETARGKLAMKDAIGQKTLSKRNRRARISVNSSALRRRLAGDSRGLWVETSVHERL
jgi:hypothetical protein